ncbi:hypothetical protein Tco_0688566 [Tanacetum coccineum]
MPDRSLGQNRSIIISSQAFTAVSLIERSTVPNHNRVDFSFLSHCKYDEFFNDGTSRVNKSSSPTDNSTPQDTPPTTNIHPTSEPSTPINVHAENQLLHCSLEAVQFFVAYAAHKVVSSLSDGREMAFLNGSCEDADMPGCVDTPKHLLGIQFLSDEVKLAGCQKKQDRNAMSSQISQKHNHGQPRAHSVQATSIPLSFQSRNRFQYLVRQIGMRCLTPAELEVLTNESA